MTDEPQPPYWNYPLFGLDPRKGMFRRYEIPISLLCVREPIFRNQVLTSLVMEVQRRLRQLDRFLEEAWMHVHHSIAAGPRFEQGTCLDQRMKDPDWINATRSKFDIAGGEADMASDAAEAFYLFGFRVLDITRIVTNAPVARSF